MINFAIYNTHLGYFYIEYYNNTLLKINLLHTEPTNYGYKSIFSDNVYNQLLEYLQGNRYSFHIKYKLIGTEFQKKVWLSVINIPYGKTKTYKDIAIEIGNSNACRAVGMANNKNPILIIVPCHRVIGSNGAMLGYSGGVNVKKYLLNLEKNQQNT